MLGGNGSDPVYGIQKMNRIGLCAAQVGCSPGGGGEGWRPPQLSEKGGVDPLGVVSRAMIIFINNIH